MKKGVLKFEVLIPNEPIKIQKLQNGCQRVQNRNIFTKSTLKFEFKVVIFTGLFYLHIFVIMYNQIWYYYTKTASKKIQNGC